MARKTMRPNMTPSIGSPPHGADAGQQVSMALGRPAYKVGDRQASRIAQADLVARLGVAVAHRRLGPSSATTSTTWRRGWLRCQLGSGSGLRLKSGIPAPTEQLR